MKIFIYILIAFATVLVVFNATKLDFDHLLEGDSFVAAVCIMAGLCAILALGILLISRGIAAKQQKR
ncbi:hypothetical protein [Aequorivita capsosiphonis]|uniref:hypothetical protein n=1 Tax=Aequorivita capsosiphonis TaxID=487317 RepID=UPI0003F69214|nr:hypothetical protein [Aequorivita capsosiphonis]